MKRLISAVSLLTVLAAPSYTAPIFAAPVKKPVTKPAKPQKPAPKPVSKPKPTPKPEPVVVPIETGPKTWALLVGVSQYQNTQISSLRSPSKDAISMKEVLTDPSVGGLPPSQVLLLTDADATRDKIMGAVGTFLRPNVKHGDKVIVFLAGHGVAKGAGSSAKSYFLPTDVRGLTTAAFDSSAVPLRALANDLGTLPASQFVVFVDACREDPTPGRGVKGNSLTDVMSRGLSIVPQDQTAQAATFFACSIGQRAFEDEKYGHGVFTNWILQGLKHGDVPQKPDGAVDLARLSSYVEQKVKQWAKDTSASGDFEVQQTPELVTATPLSGEVVLLKVKRPFSDSPLVSAPPRLMIAASPEGAQVTINGARAGVGTVEKSLPSAGDYTVTVSMLGYAPIARSVKAMNGYEHQVVFQLQPNGPGGVAIATDDRAADFYRRALEAQEREQFEIAEQGYMAALGANPRFFAASEALFELHHLQNRNLDVISDALGLLSGAPTDVHALSLTSRAYSEFAIKGAGDANANANVSAISGFGKPKNEADAAKLALRAAKAAVALNGNSSEANLALGYALAALDAKGKNKREALAALGKAAFADPTDPANHLGLGYGIRFYAMQRKTDDEKNDDIGRAIAALQEAVKLRPNYYEAHRELAFCYIQLGDTKTALKECRLARSNRGGASDANEIAGVEVAMAGLHEKVAQNSSGDEKAANEAASQGYLSDAKETSPDLKNAVSILNAAGVSTSLASYLPSQLLPLLNIRGTIEGKIRGAIPGLPGGFKLPF